MVIENEIIFEVETSIHAVKQLIIPSGLNMQIYDWTD